MDSTHVDDVAVERELLGIVEFRNIEIKFGKHRIEPRFHFLRGLVVEEVIQECLFCSRIELAGKFAAVLREFPLEAERFEQLLPLIASLHGRFVSGFPTLIVDADLLDGLLFFCEIFGSTLLCERLLSLIEASCPGLHFAMDRDKDSANALELLPASPEAVFALLDRIGSRLCLEGSEMAIHLTLVCFADPMLDLSEEMRDPLVCNAGADKEDCQNGKPEASLYRSENKWRKQGESKDGTSDKKHFLCPDLPLQDGLEMIHGFTFGAKWGHRIRRHLGGREFVHITISFMRVFRSKECSNWNRM